MNISIFDIPHINDNVTSYLSQRDLVQCAQASRKWNSWFTPALWRNLVLEPSSFPTAAIQRNNIHIQSLDITKNLDFITPTSSYPSLQSLYYTPGISFLFQDDLVLGFLRTVQSLQSLTLRVPLSPKEIHSQLLDIFQLLPRLKMVDLTSPKTISAIKIQQIIQACSQFETLRLSIAGPSEFDIPVSKEEEQEQCDLTKITMSRMKPTMIQELSIELMSETQESIILPALLNRCPSLRSFDIKRILHPTTFPQIINVLEAGRCPHLKSVRLCYLNHDTREEDLARLVRAIGCRAPNNINSIDNINDKDVGTWSWETNDIPSEKGGLQTFTFDSILPFNSRCAQALTHHHANTLTILKLIHPRLRVELAVGLMSELPHLQSVAIWFKFKGDERLDILFGTQWSCLKLKHLMSVIKLSNNLTPQAGDGSLEDCFLRYLFSQIGRLTELEEWEPISQLDLFSIEKYLTWLPQLKNLRGLNLKGCLNDNIDIVEAEWILQHWTRLVHVTSYPYGGFTWFLRVNRPWLRIEPI